MRVLIVLGVCEYLCVISEMPCHGSIMDTRTLQDESIKNLVTKELGCFVGVKYSGAGWHHKYGELPRLELHRLEQQRLW
ncbi:MAG: hypothetical protein KatS3mg101_0560 [Patescibacteria group bacterium]|nr:MAG: hypothetical protein KatS3mg101_0560 [Patescibacteria group bacterium]